MTKSPIHAIITPRGEISENEYPNCGSIAQLELVGKDSDSYDTKKVKEYICGCGCKFEAIFELKETKILEIDEPYF